MSNKQKSGGVSDAVRFLFNNRFVRNLPATATLVAGIMQLSWGADYSAWPYYQTLTITPDSAVTAAVTNFPLLVYLTSADSAVFTGSRSDGFDVQFTAADGSTPLSFQRQSFSDSSRTAEFWVLVPTIAANPATTSIKMYWGNPAATDVQNPGATFDTAAGYNYRAVWHMNASSGSNEPDATQSGHDLVPSNSPSLATGGPVGAGGNKSFDGATQYFIANNSGGTSSSLIFPPGGPLTISAWINPSTTPTGVAILGKINTGSIGTWTGSYGWVYRGTTSGTVGFNDHNGTTGFERCDYSMPSGQWTHVVWVRNGLGTSPANTNVWINGVASGTENDSDNTTNATRVDSLSFTMGVDAFLSGDTASEYWGGSIQEVQIADVAWSPSWISLSYQDQSAPSTLITFGATVAVRPKKADLSKAQPQLLLKGENLEYVLSKAAPVEISFIDLSGKTVLAINRSESAGSHMLQLNNINLSQGTYLACLKTSGFEKRITVNITR